MSAEEEIGVSNLVEDVSDVVPATVPQNVYDRTKEQLEASGYKIFTIDRPRSVGEIQRTGEIRNNVHGPGSAEFSDFTPSPVEIAINPERPFLSESDDLSLDQQGELLKEYELSFHDEEYPEDSVEGVRVGLLPAAVVTEADALFLRETGRPLITAKDYGVEDPDQGDNTVSSEQWVTCGDKLGGGWIVRYGRTGGEQIPMVAPVFSKNPDGKTHSRVLRAVLLPTPSE